jgi:L-ascorbate metabolism protein UlaG (beta-lactamase superfamily)
MKYTYYGQSCFLLEADGKKLLFDPFISHNPLAKHIDISSIEADYIFVSHGHEDHAQVVAMVEVATWASKQGLTKLIPMNYGSLKLDFGKVRMVWATHSSSLPDSSYGGNPAGYVLELEGKAIYFAGDTSLTLEMKLLADLYNLDYAILPIGGHFTMDVDDALIATKYFDCDQVIGVHYDTFAQIEIDKEEAVAKFKRENKTLLLPAIGETIEL